MLKDGDIHIHTYGDTDCNSYLEFIVYSLVNYEEYSLYKISIIRYLLNVLFGEYSRSNPSVYNNLCRRVIHHNTAVYLYERCCINVVRGVGI